MQRAFRRRGGDEPASAGARVARAYGMRQTYPLLAGVVAGLLVAGLAVPLVFGERAQIRQVSGPVAAPAGSDVGGEGPAGAGEQAASPGSAPIPRRGAAGGAVSGAQGGSGTPGSGRPANATLRATDRGVSADGIRLGVLIPDTGGLARAGVDVEGADPAAYREAYGVYLDQINKRGGVLGRQIRPVYETFDPLSADAQRAACVSLTQDKKVFAILNNAGFFGDSVLCVTEQNRTLLMSNDGMADEWYARSRELLFTTDISKTRVLRNQVWELHIAKILAGKKIGVVDGEFPGGKEAVDAGLLATLRQLNYTVTHHSRLSADPGVAQSQIPNEVQQMRAKGVDLVFFATNFIYTTNFAQQAEASQWFPLYTTSDMAAMTTDFTTSNMPDSFDGAIGITTRRTGEWRVGIPEPAVDADCRKTFEAATGRKLERGTNPYGVAIVSCALTRMFATVATRTGVELTMPAFSRTFQSLGQVEIPSYAGGSYAPGKFDGPDFVRTIRWGRDCRCYKPIDKFRRGRY